MATVRDLATDALLDLGVLAAGEVGTSDDLNGALRALNRLLDQWAAERLQIYTVTATTFTIVSGTQDYAIGASQAINRARPVYVNGVSYRDNSSPAVEQGLVEYTDQDWQRVTIKTLESEEPTAFYYNPTYPYGTVTLWPKPTSATLTGVLYAPTAVAEFTSLTTAVALPPGYARMIVKNLALELAPSYQREPNPLLMAQAAKAKEVVKRSNFRPRDMSFDPFSLISDGGAYDIRSDT